MKINKNLVQQFQNTLNNALKDQPESQDIKALNEIIVNSLTEAADDHKAANKNQNNKLSEETLNLMKKWKQMLVKTNQNKIELLN